jgi:hypothetical protein
MRELKFTATNNIIRPINHETKNTEMCTQTLPALGSSYIPKIRRKSNFSQVKIGYTKDQLYMYVQAGPVEIKIPALEPDRPMNDHPIANVIAQQYSSLTLMSSYFHSCKENSAHVSKMFNFVSFTLIKLRKCQSS